MALSWNPIPRLSIMNYFAAVNDIYNRTKFKLRFIGFIALLAFRSAARILFGCENFSKFFPACCLSRFASGVLGPYPIHGLEEISKLFSQGCLVQRCWDINLSSSH